MIVYIDIAFMLAFFQDFMLLLAAGGCVKEKTRLLRIVSGSFVGAVYQTINIFYPVKSVIASVVVAFMQIAVAYGNNRIKLTAVFIAEAALTAGIMYAAKSDYYGILFVLCITFMPRIASVIRKELVLSKLKRTLAITKDGKTILVQGIVDSGNSSGLIIIGKQHAKSLLGKDKADAMNSLKEGEYSLILCNTVKGDVLLPVFKADCVISDGEEINAKIGVSKEKMSCALLPVNYLEMRDFDVDGKVNTKDKTAVSQKNLLHRRQSDTSCTA